MNETMIDSTNKILTMDFRAIKARQKSTWEAGDFGEVAKYNVPSAEAFMSRVELRPGLRVLDVACGTGNLAVIAARYGCTSFGVDIATNLIAQARKRAAAEGLDIELTEGDAEALPYENESFDMVVSMFGAMFAPRPEIVASELLRVTRPKGLILMANWTPEGFVGKMFEVSGRYVTPPVGLPSPLLWGNEPTVQHRFKDRLAEISLTRRMAILRYPFDPAGTVEFFRKYFGPTQRAFAGLGPKEQEGLRRDLQELQSRHNSASSPNETETAAEYLEVRAVKAG